METILSHILHGLMNGQPTMHHNPGIWNGIWSDMFIKLRLCAIDMVMVGLSASHSNQKLRRLGLIVSMYAAAGRRYCNEFANSDYSKQHTKKKCVHES